MTIHTKPVARDDLEAFRAFAATTFQSSVLFALRTHRQKAVKAFQRPANAGAVTGQQPESRLAQSH